MKNKDIKENVFMEDEYSEEYGRKFYPKNVKHGKYKSLDHDRRDYWQE